MRSRPLLVAFPWLVLAACAPAPPPVVTAEVPPTAFDSGTDLERLFPLVDGNLWHYDTELGDGERGRLVVRAARASPEGGTLTTGGDARRVRFTAEGVLLAGATGDVFVLKGPLTVGATWRGEHGGITEVSAVGRQVTVPAGTFEGCVDVVERRGGDRPMQVVTTYCPDVGMVELEASAGEQVERAMLRSYGPPVDLGPDGVRAVPPEG